MSREAEKGPQEGAAPPPCHGVSVSASTGSALTVSKAARGCVPFGAAYQNTRVPVLFRLVNAKQTLRTNELIGQRALALSRFGVKSAEKEMGVNKNDASAERSH